MLLLVGLGNPGPKYVTHRHNIGFMVLQEVMRYYHLSPWKRRFQGILSLGSIEDLKICILLPQTFMNLCGRSVYAAQVFYKLSLDQIIVFHDDVDLCLARVKVKKGGGSAGHKGLQNIDQSIGGEYLRVRIGIGRPAENTPVDRYVLEDFRLEEQSQMTLLLQACTKALPLLLQGSPDRFMNKITLSSKVSQISLKPEN